MHANPQLGAMTRKWHEEGLCSLKVSLSRPDSGSKEYASGTGTNRNGEDVGPYKNRGRQVGIGLEKRNFKRQF